MNKDIPVRFCDDVVSLEEFVCSVVCQQHRFSVSFAQKRVLVGVADAINLLSRNSEFGPVGVADANLLSQSNASTGE
jgi:hypothetical protein